MSAETSSATAFCRDCGAEISNRAEICPECGVRQHGQTEDPERANRAKQFLIAGGVLGFIAILFLPIVFGILAAFCGILAMYYGQPLAGAGIVAWAVIATIIGYILGVLALFMA